MPNIKKKESERKVVTSFSIKKGIIDRYNDICRADVINRSDLVERVIVDFIEKYERG